MMPHINESLLQGFVLSSNPDADLFIEVRNHLAECSACRQVEKFLRDINERLAAPLAPIRPELEAFVESLSRSARVLHLRPFEHIHPVEPAPNEPIVLAAHSPESQPRFQTVSTLVSEDESALLKIVFDSVQSVHTLSLQTVDPSTRALALVEIPEWHSTCITDDRGFAELRLTPSATAAHPPQAVMYLPDVVVDFRIDLLNRSLESTLIHGSLGGVRCTLTEHFLDITEDHEDGKRRLGRIVVIGKDRLPEILDFSGGRMRIDISTLIGPLRIAFYS